MAEAILLSCTLLFFFLSWCRCQPDCSAVQCPLLDGCIEETLQRGACCASCSQKGCVCEGYQRYDCINAGFKNGKVPEGDSYFVDYGSTECSCPAGGGRISCHFISCPDVPANCIDFSEPPDGCVQCERIGCFQDGEKYEAGHSFHMAPCQVCHCPHEGGKLMCYEVPDCDPQGELTDDAYLHRLDQEQDTDHISTQFLFPPNGKLRLYDKEEEPDGHDSTQLPRNIPQPLVLPTTPLFGLYDAAYRSSAPEGWNRRDKLELREPHGAHDVLVDRQEMTGQVRGVKPSTARPQFTKASETVLRNSSLAGGSSTDPTDQIPAHKSIFSLNQELQREEKPEFSHVTTETQAGGLNTSDGSADTGLQSHTKGSRSGLDVEMHRIIEEQHGEHIHLQVLRTTLSPRKPLTAGSEERSSVDEFFTEKKDREELTVAEGKNNVLLTTERTYKPEPSTASPQNTTPPVHLTSTSIQPTGPHSVRKPEQKLLHPHTDANEESGERTNNQDQETHHLVSSLKPTGGPTVNGEDLLVSCCAIGRLWANENHHCDHMTLMDNNRQSVCSVLQKQCCLSSVKDVQCKVGVASARRGETCEKNRENSCSDDSFHVCCSCCALGLRMRREHRGCGIHQHLGFPCGHVFITCCEDEDHLSHFMVEKKRLSTDGPKEVSDRKFPKQAFFISGPDEDDDEDEDECQLNGGQLCQHLCTNMWGSYICGCHQGYTLQPDGHSCAPVNPEEDDRVTEAETSPSTISTTSSTMTSITSESSAPADPCASGNDACTQQCTAVGGRGLCSCFPGFSLMDDGLTCEDVDECVTNTHSCRQSQMCVNMVGSFVCEQQRRISCPEGFQQRRNVCVDIDECEDGTHTCGVGSVCENTVGSFLCGTKLTCLTGFTHDSHGNCVGSSCINTVGSFTCRQRSKTCSYGYHSTSDGTKCVDVDECEVGVHRCGTSQICHNLPGTYRCDCQTGYKYDSLRKVCNDVNECWLRVCAHMCVNSPGSFHCSCSPGFFLASDGKNCEDVNECDQSPCSQQCANIHGSYQCYCQQGFSLKEDGHSCHDIDECSQSVGALCSFHCVNTEGSYQCSCPPIGYVLSANGHACRDVDECTSGTHNCSSEQRCYNLQGSYRCLSFDCPISYKKVSDTRCERVSCPANSLECQNAPMRISHYQLSFQNNIIVPAQIFRIGPSPTYSGDHVIVSIVKGNQDGYFSTRKLNSFTGAVYLQRQVGGAKDFLIDVEMKLLRQGTLTSFLSRIYVFITSSSM
ncbi:fibulin-2 isoform X2 [Gouania willdenowi]|uniref:fibulin-2 isoform X2 n=1 Tax=Gouania willdenowi TaxID=441366 RepID=UPI001055C199|nr:fibulin-2-like isoform X2 [Gouania willdenowi]